MQSLRLRAWAGEQHPASEREEGREVPTFPDELLKWTEIEVHVPKSTDKEGHREMVRN